MSNNYIVLVESYKFNIVADEFMYTSHGGTTVVTFMNETPHEKNAMKTVASIFSKETILVCDEEALKTT